MSSFSWTAWYILLLKKGHLEFPVSFRFLNDSSKTWGYWSKYEFYKALPGLSHIQEKVCPLMPFFFLKGFIQFHLGIFIYRLTFQGRDESEFLRLGINQCHRISTTGLWSTHAGYHTYKHTKGIQNLMYRTVFFSHDVYCAAELLYDRPPITSSSLNCHTSKECSFKAEEPFVLRCRVVCCCA